MTDTQGALSVLQSGPALKESSGALILLHGRGGSAKEMLSLGVDFGLPEVTLLAPQAENHTWYPNSFLAPIASNQPWLSMSLSEVERVVERCLTTGMRSDRIALLGFSQGACLSCEFVAQHPRRYAGLIAFTGGLIGPLGSDMSRAGSLENTPVLLSSGDPDPHVPWERVEETARQFTQMGASVKLKRYPNRPHTVLPEETENARHLLADAFVMPPT